MTDSIETKPPDMVSAGHTHFRAGMICAAVGFLGMVLLPEVCTAAGALELKSDTEKINYSLGYQIGGDFKAQGIDLTPEILVQGIQDALNKNQPLIPQEQMNSTLISLKKKVVADQQLKAKQTAAEARKAGAEFLKEHAAQKGVTVLPNGVQYKVITAGAGRKPTLQDSVTVNYRVTRTDGKEISSSDANAPQTYPVAKAIAGLQEVFPLMAEGSKWQIVIPASRATGGRDPIDEMGVIIYELELITVVAAK